ncbi:MAG TPA: DUF1732 domain-containing protein [bacterium]|nr:DUF1732 domain-containing protein [bacterium]HPJ72035.1 DUF1732 domain-containing protein [bacterium]HPQ65134.1 DUF1732 domain-containing protein [bacterium]
MKSMTGYGDCRARGSDFSVQVELQSYNHRFLDIMIKVPPEYAKAETLLLGELRRRFERGRFNVHVSVHVAAARARGGINRALAASYWKELQRLAKDLRLPGLDPGVLVALPGVVEFASGAPSFKEFRAVMEEALAGALERLEKTREREGVRIRTDMRRHLRRLETGFAKAVSALRRRSADRSPNVEEEVNRLSGHIAQFRRLLEGDGAAGKALEFVTREMVREVTTLADKACNSKVSVQGVLMKVEIESLKEQARNVE